MVSTRWSINEKNVDNVPCSETPKISAAEAAETIATKKSDKEDSVNFILVQYQISV